MHQQERSSVTSPVVAAVREGGSAAQAELLERLRAGDRDAFAELVDAWSPVLLRVALLHVSTRASAEEVVQDTWLAVIGQLDRFEGRSSLKTWVYRILVNAAKQRGTKEGRTLPLSSLPARADTGPTVDPDRFRGPDDPYPGDWRVYPKPWVMPSPEQAMLAGEIRTEMAAALAGLPDRQRIVITLRDIEGHTTAEVCEILEITPVYQRVLLHRARAFVRGKLEEYFSASGDAPEAGNGTVP
jgi:RNA polymerase sigma-70 factor (ECF subfamily)